MSGIAALPMRATVSLGASRVEIRPLEGPLGAEIVGLDVKGIDQHAAALLRKAWHDNIVLVFKGQPLEPQELVTLANVFGTAIASKKLAKHKVTDGYGRHLYDLPPEITVKSNIKIDGKDLGSLGDDGGEINWHSDHSFNETPSAARMLYGAQMPSDGPDTAFSNQCAAFDLLPDRLKARIHGRTIKHDNSFDLMMRPREGIDPNADIRLSGGVNHPIISTHPDTGHNSVFLGRRKRAYINGLGLAESEDLLEELWEHCTQPQFSYSHRWSNNDLVLWDNRCTLHRRDPIPGNAPRLLYAAQGQGHRPFEANDSLIRPPHPRYFSARAQ